MPQQDGDIYEMHVFRQHNEREKASTTRYFPFLIHALCILKQFLEFIFGDAAFVLVFMFRKEYENDSG